MPKCKQCNFENHPNRFGVAEGKHDLACPQCGTTSIDTTDINVEWYGYGNNNTQQTAPIHKRIVLRG